jgi:hypothetical protein
MKHIISSMILFASFNTFALTAQEELNFATEEMVTEIIEGLNLEQAEEGEESETLTIAIPQQDPNDPKKDGIITNIKIRPYVATTIGSSQMGIINLVVGLDTRYLGADVSLGMGGMQSNNVVPGYYESNGVTTFTGAMRLKITNFLEVGARYMSQDYVPTITEEYTKSLRNLGYDVRVNIPFDNQFSAIVNISGLKKGSVAPNFIQAGFKFRLSK